MRIRRVIKKKYITSSQVAFSNKKKKKKRDKFPLPTLARRKAIDIFCETNNIRHNKNYDSFYFTIQDTEYRISNHSIDSSIHYDKKQRKVINHHIDGNEFKNSPDYCNQVKCYYASQNRLEKIYRDIQAGLQLDNHGRRK